MIYVLEIKIEEFKDNIYNKYIKLFPKDEQREWSKIEATYRNGIEKFYKIILNNETIGFFMLEKLNDDYPFYLDYFAIFEEYQNLGYGTKSIQILMDEIVNDNGLIGEIEKVDEKNPISLKRFKFYEKLGFEKIESEYLLYNVFYNPIAYYKNKEIEKTDIDKKLFDYYRTNCRRKCD